MTKEIGLACIVAFPDGIDLLVRAHAGSKKQVYWGRWENSSSWAFPNRPRMAGPTKRWWN